MALMRLQKSADDAAPKAAPTDDAASSAAASDAPADGDLLKQALAAAPASGMSLIVAFLLVLAGLVLAWIVYRRVDPSDFTPGSDYAAFAGLFVVALALERLLEPFSGFVLPSADAKKAERDAAVAKAVNTRLHGDLKAAAQRQAELDRLRASRAVLLWGIGALLAMLASGTFGLFLLRSLEVAPPSAKDAAAKTQATPTTHDSGAKDPNRAIDLLVTGLVVAAGTKPLHDLVTRIQATKERGKDPAETSTSK